MYNYNKKGPPEGDPVIVYKVNSRFIQSFCT